VPRRPEFAIGDRHASVNYPRLIATLAAVWGAFMWSHPPTAFQFGHDFADPLWRCLTCQREWKGLVSVRPAILLWVTLSSAYLFAGNRGTKVRSLIGRFELYGPITRVTS
jgi:hypothetical protein